MRIAMLFYIFLIAGCVHAPKGNTTQLISTPICAKKAGFIAGPFVSTTSAARAIAEAIITDIQSKAVRAKYNLEISDAGDYWAANQFPKDLPQAADEESDTYVSTFGGGGLSMRISKCDGTITRVHGMR